MKLISAILCSTAAVGASFTLPALASANDVHCVAERGADVTLLSGTTGCRAASDTFGHAQAAGVSGVGYARATEGATAYGFGLAGGIGASEGVGGFPLAIGHGRDAVALTSVTDPGGSAVAVTIAFEGSQAQVVTADGTVVCLGAAALAWDARTGASCLATPFGRWVVSPA